ncbi:hypothetical protein CT0861_06482, partial [Colletotrichum tofieldiae]
LQATTPIARRCPLHPITRTDSPSIELARSQNGRRSGTRYQALQVRHWHRCPLPEHEPDQALLAELRRLPQVHQRQGRGLRPLPPVLARLPLSVPLRLVHPLGRAARGWQLPRQARRISDVGLGCEQIRQRSRASVLLRDGSRLHIEHRRMCHATKLRALPGAEYDFVKTICSVRPYDHLYNSLTFDTIPLTRSSGNSVRSPH